ncbi:MAG: hypothetical protein HDS68_01485 [Bacteroidales bacterium]|nr:hypothetical protein [Bacteroidales bacterium]
MKTLHKILISFAVAMGVSLNASAASKATWEEVSSPVPSVVQSLESEAEVGIVVADGYIYISSEKPITIKIFSILGQLISQESLKPGMHRIKLDSRGIFILRAGSTTRRITL